MLKIIPVETLLCLQGSSKFAKSGFFTKYLMFAVKKNAEILITYCSYFSIR